MDEREIADIMAIYGGAGFDDRRPNPELARRAVLDAAARVFSRPSLQILRPAGRNTPSKQVVMAAIEYSDAVVARRPSILELCSATSVSERRLMYAFRDVTGLSPRRFLALAALNHAHDHLVRASPDLVNVGDLAFDLGFYHLGRFAREYRRLYGETPSETLRRART